jgi:hypothetical protein
LETPGKPLYRLLAGLIACYRQLSYLAANKRRTHTLRAVYINYLAAGQD